MLIYLHIFMYTYILIHTWICVSLCIYTHAHMFVYVYVCVRVYRCTFVRFSLRACLCVLQIFTQKWCKFENVWAQEVRKYYDEEMSFYRSRGSECKVRSEIKNEWRKYWLPCIITLLRMTLEYSAWIYFMRLKELEMLKAS